MMRRLFPLGLLFLLPACSYVGNPFDGFGSFIGDTVTFHTKANQPQGDAPNMLRVTGQEAPSEPLLPEPGNVWPGPLPPARTLSDLAHDPNLMPGTSTMTPLAPTPTVPPLRMAPPPPNQPGASASPNQPGASVGRVLQTPSGPAITSIGNNGVETFTMPNGRTGIVVNNGNGTATLNGADGATMIAPIPK